MTSFKSSQKLPKQDVYSMSNVHVDSKKPIRIFLEKKGFKFVDRPTLTPKEFKLNLKTSVITVVCDFEVVSKEEQHAFALEVAEVLQNHPDKRFTATVEKGNSKYRIIVKDTMSTEIKPEKKKGGCLISGKKRYQ